MRKRLQISKKFLVRALISVGIPCLVLLILFFNSDIPALISRPKKPKNSISSPQTLTKNEQIKSQDDSLINRICIQYGNIEFIQREQRLIEGGTNSFGFPKFETVEYTSVPVPDSIKIIAGLDKNFTYLDRMKAADALGNNLTAAEQRALLHFLHKKTSDDKLIPIKLNAVKNQVCMALMRQIPANKDFPLHLIGMYFDENIDPVFQNYCIQFLGQCYEQIDTAEHRKIARETLFKALDKKQETAAAAIIAIDGLSKHSGFVRKEIAEAAYNLASDGAASNMVKIPALQIAAKYKHPKAVQLAKDFLKDKDCPVILKMSAIATLGNYGEKKDIDLISKYEKSADIRLKSAAKTALKKLRS